MELIKSKMLRLLVESTVKTIIIISIIFECVLIVPTQNV